MEDFLRRFRISAGEASAVRTFYKVSSYYSCSHLKRDCLVGALCMKQDFRLLCERALANDDVQMAEELIAMAEQTLLDRETLWVHMHNMTSLAPPDDIDQQIDDLMNRLKNMYWMHGMQQQARTLPALRDPHRVYIDDTTGTMPYFYVPIVQGQIPRIEATTRYRGCAVAFYRPTPEMDFAPFDLRALRRQLNDVKTAIQHEFPICPSTGKRCGIHRIVFLPYKMRAHLERDEFIHDFMRRVESDGWMLQNLRTELEKSFILQRFGVYPAGGEPIDAIMLRQIVVQDGITNLVRMRVLNEGGESWSSWTCPYYLVRLALNGVIPWDVVNNYILGKEACQLCYLKNVHKMGEVHLFDVRSANILGTSPARVGQNVAHYTDVEDVRNIVLNGKQQVMRFGNHWIVMTPYTSMESLLLLAQTVHRTARGNGGWGTTEWVQNMNLMSRVLFMWNNETNFTGAMLRLYCFVCFGYMPRENGSVCDWLDYGKFLNIILNHQPMSMDEEEACYSVMMQLAVNSMYWGNRLKFVDNILEVERDDAAEVAVAALQYQEEVRRWDWGN
ncbi:tubule [Wallal virus]|uniref:Non-structural protein NS1 n=1 Tax=Wallal virus TaxID=40061 RepID=U3RF10_9REOV|nr:tubule [Wallal virus]AGX00991.1 tubule [Wallal virus]